jgi:hypothetical protein
MFKPKRWSGDNDRYFGPFTFCVTDNPKLALMLSSGGGEYPGCYVRLSVWKFTAILALPQWVLKPYSEKVMATGWDAATIERLGRDYYYNVYEREYGVHYWDGWLSLHLGRQTHSSCTTQSWSCFLPWTQWRHVRTSHYGINGEHFITEAKSQGPFSMNEWRDNQDAVAKCPTVCFEFKDYDGEQLFARTKIEEREWKFGTGYFKWLSFFRKPKIRRSLDIRFSGETGKRKGSWKGGTTGHGIDMLEGELHHFTFVRYCAEHDMLFIGELKNDPTPDQRVA